MRLTGSKDAQFVRAGPDLRLRNLFICPRSGPGTSPRRSCTHSGREQQPGELTRGKALALLRRYTLLLGEGGWFGAGANREKGFLLPKGPALAFARFQLRAWEGERRAGAATMGLGAPYPPIRPTFINWVGRTTREVRGKCREPGKALYPSVPRKPHYYSQKSQSYRLLCTKTTNPWRDISARHRALQQCAA